MLFLLATTKLLVEYPNATQPLVGLFYINSTALGVAYLNDTTIRIIDMTGKNMFEVWCKPHIINRSQH